MVPPGREKARRPGCWPSGWGSTTSTRGPCTGPLRLECLSLQVPLDDEARVAEVARGLRIEALGPIVRSNGRDVTAAVRAPEISSSASRVAATPAVREAMVHQQRETAHGKNVVTEGRDQGTIVFPDALCKFYLTAHPDERARRRQRELEKQGERVTFEELRSPILERDTRDKTRETAPLVAAGDAQRIDTTNMTTDEVVASLEKIVRARMAARRA